MKSIISKLLLFAFIAISVTSCTIYRDVSYKYNTSPVYDLEQSQVTNGTLETILEMTGEVTASYTITTKIFATAEDLKKLVEGTYIVDDDFLLRFKSDKTNKLYAEAKATVLHMALEKSGCDMILAPIYKLEVKGKEFSSNGGRVFTTSRSSETTYTISVKGFGANIRGVKQIKTN